ncbi:MAG: hypothetical protein JST04_07800 [Bdellovibrionales bacterium]|nr:hypothetical protein [Bdellovibrionales bacterium]
METRFLTRLTVFALFVLGGMIFVALQPAARASEPSRFICAARVDCGAPALPSVQELPTIRTPIVSSPSAEKAKDQCVSKHWSAYARLSRSIDGMGAKSPFESGRGCKIVSEVLPTK